MQSLNQFPLLSVIAYIPLIGALAITFLIPKEKTRTIKYFATFVAALDFVVSLPLWFGFDREGGYRSSSRLRGSCLRRRLSLRHRRHFIAAAHDVHRRHRITLPTRRSRCGEGVLRPAPSPSVLHDRHVLRLDFFRLYVFWERGPDVLDRVGRRAMLRSSSHTPRAGSDFWASSLSTSTTRRASSGTQASTTRRPSIEKADGRSAGCHGASDLALRALPGWHAVPMFPFHTWLPDGYRGSTAGSVILAAILQDGNGSCFRCRCSRRRARWVVGTDHAASSHCYAYGDARPEAT